MARRPYALLLPALLLLPPLGALVGGWATVTVEDLPEYVETGTPLALSFVVRQHGVNPMKGLNPTLEARAGGNTVRAAAEPGNNSGQYMARLSLREPGDWTVTINGGHGDSKLTLLPIRVIPTGAPAPAALPEHEKGRRLFVAKGCVSCHMRNDADVGSGEAIGPALTGKRWQAEFLRRFLADPAANPTHTGRFRMPNLGLQQAEIASLVAFLNEDGRQ